METDTHIIVTWYDVTLYRGQSPPRLAEATTNGLLVRDTPEYVLVRSAETLVRHWDGAEERKPAERTPDYFYIPRSLIIDVIKQ